MKKLSLTTEPTILCLSHLGWDFVWQRPQHILSRLAQRYPVIYVNEPLLVKPRQSEYPADGKPYMRLVGQEANLTAWQPIFPNRPAVFSGWREIYMQQVRELLAQRQGNGRTALSPSQLILWFYTPAPYYFLEHFPANLVVYDIMDELANFKGAAADLREQEAKVLARADVVFTGGRSMYMTRRKLHPNLHLFASGVEPAHFAQALHPQTPIAPEVLQQGSNGRRPQAVLGYYGVIDERLDLELLHQLASGHPEWEIFMVGPVAKIDAADLPRLPNIHYTGRQPYERLPHFLKGFDVCLMPFALNDATKSISPTKALEYMAAHKPIVSTAVPDVVANWSHIVRIAANPDCFAEMVAAALSEKQRERAVREKREKELLARHTWDSIVGQMISHIETALVRKQTQMPTAVSYQPPATRHQSIPGVAS